MSATLLLDPEPQSVRRARHWIVEGLQQLGRPDLADAAELGISELVTNAILHAEPPITVRLGGTAQHPRIEVHDTSPRPPTVHSDMADDDKLLSAVGRGLGIVALYSSSWGAEVSAAGKVVWFEPALEPDQPPAGDMFDLERTVDALLSATDPPARLITVSLLGMPVQDFAAFRVWYAEMRRELRLLALAHPDDYPLAGALSEISLRVEQERRQSRGIEALDSAIERRLTNVDLEYQVPSTAAQTMARLGELLVEVDRFCDTHQLLTMPATPDMVALRQWYAGEFVRQGAGLAPTPWPGRPPA